MIIIYIESFPVSQETTNPIRFILTDLGVALLWSDLGDNNKTCKLDNFKLLLDIFSVHLLVFILSCRKHGQI